jgi:DNA polymerase III subunit epsilon
MPIAVIDFETTGSSPGQGARATEIAAVLVEGGRIVGHYQSLMYSGAWVPPFIEQLTGISNAMLADAPPAARVMGEVLRFTAGCPLVAHNAAFDRAFWRAESLLAGLDGAHGAEAGCEIDHGLLCQLQGWPGARVERELDKHRRRPVPVAVSAPVSVAA